MSDWRRLMSHRWWHFCRTFLASKTVGQHWTEGTVSGFPQKSENRIPWLFHDWFASFHDSHSHMVSDIIMIVSHNMHNNHKLESCHSHENKQFHDFSMTFHDNNFFHDFPWQQFFPWFSMTVGTLQYGPLDHSGASTGQNGLVDHSQPKEGGTN